MVDQRQSDRPASGDLFEHALQAMLGRQPPTTSRSSAAADGFLFSGNRHDAVPRALLLDRRLTPLERNAWQVLRLLLNDDGVTRLPTYDHLSRYLTSMPCAERASHETVSRALTMLRLTRWISLARRLRDRRTGRLRGNLYVLHDAPLTPYEAIQIDPEYLTLLCNALTHASKSVQRVGACVLDEMKADELLRNQILPTRLRILMQRIAVQNRGGAPGYPQPVDNDDSEDSEAYRLRNRERIDEAFAERQNPCKTDCLRNPKSDRTVRKKEINKNLRTTPRARDAINVPARLMTLKPEQRSGAWAALQAVDTDMHQAILDEWDTRCRQTAIHNPAGYLFGIIQKALRGEFHAWAAKAPAVPP